MYCMAATQFRKKIHDTPPPTACVGRNNQRALRRGYQIPRYSPDAGASVKPEGTIRWIGQVGKNWRWATMTAPGPITIAPYAGPMLEQYREAFWSPSCILIKKFHTVAWAVAINAKINRGLSRLSILLCLAPPVQKYWPNLGKFRANLVIIK